MKVTDINIDQILFTPTVREDPYDHGEETGFFKKLFSKKEKDETPYFNTRVEQFGRDALYDDIKEKCDAYLVKNAPAENMVVLSKSFLILPGKEILPFYDMISFSIQNEPATERPYEQYAIDRFNEPYDPSFVSEYDNEEGFELARFNILLQIVDENRLRYDYVFPMEVSDRKDFREKLNERLTPIGVIDLSYDDVMEGQFTDDDVW
ncbi:MAG: hypothetical protein K5643_08655 [Saccharofermentans sp.]|nr:hypothetical protein [Saccharofermentans sp.]